MCGAIALAPSNPDIVYVGTGEANGSGDSFYGRGVLKSTNGGSTWTLLGDQFDGRTISRIVVDPANANRAFVCVAGSGVNGLGGNRGIWRTTDGGLNWTNISTVIGADPATIDVEMQPGLPNTLLAVVSGNGVWRTTDANAVTPTWTLLGGGLPTIRRRPRRPGRDSGRPQRHGRLVRGPHD